MPLSHLLLSLAVVAVWGTNFVVVRLGLDDLPPFLFAALRFAASAFPLVFFIRRPAVAWRKLAAFGVLLGAGQFGLLFFAMRSEISPGLASLVVQMQVFFTIAVTLVAMGERVKPPQILALVLAAAGIAVIGAHLSASVVTALGLSLVLCAALCWTGANLVVKSVGRVDMLGFMVWSSVFAVPPLLLMSLAIEGPGHIADSLRDAPWSAWGAVAWQALGNTLFGFGAWNWLLARHPAATVTPAALLVPVFGLGASAVWLGESLPPWKIEATVLVMCGLILNVWISRPRPVPAFAPR